MIFNIQKFATQDGKGIRTVIFFKGCPLRCEWCSNPESQSFKHELMYEKVKCIGCLECVNFSKNDEIVYENHSIVINHSKINDPEKYLNICPAKALSVVGEAKSVEEILTEVLKDKKFYDKSGGGVTISGGEPFAQPEYLKKLLIVLNENKININIETCLHVNWQNIENLVQYVDCFLADLKHVDVEKYKKYTGGNLHLPLDNFKKLSEKNANVRFRIPIIPGFNDSIPEMSAILDFAASIPNINDVDLIPYHRFGKGKYSSLSRNYIFDEKIREIPKDKLDLFLSLCKERALKAEISE